MPTAEPACQKSPRNLTELLRCRSFQSAIPVTSPNPRHPQPSVGPPATPYIPGSGSCSAVAVANALKQPDTTPLPTPAEEPIGPPMAKSKRATGAKLEPSAADAMSGAATNPAEAGATPARTRKAAKPSGKATSRGQHSRRGPRPRFTEDQVAEALKAAGGIFSTAARYLAEKHKRPCSRPAVHNYVKNSWRLQRVTAELDEARGDFAETLLWAHIESGSERSLHFYMGTKLKHRGYTRGVEVTGKNGGPIQTQAQPPLDLSSLSDAELEVLAHLVDKAGPVQSAPSGPTRH